MEKKKCPLQVFYKEHTPNLRWLTKLSDINDKKRCFNTFVLLSRDGNFYEELYPKEWIIRLFNSKCATMMQPSDIIRNPNIEELNFIKRILKKHGFIYNRKKNELIKKV